MKQAPRENNVSPYLHKFDLALGTPLSEIVGGGGGGGRDI